jgi:hypothetical protein
MATMNGVGTAAKETDLVAGRSPTGGIAELATCRPAVTLTLVGSTGLPGFPGMNTYHTNEEFC